MTCASSKQKQMKSPACSLSNVSKKNETAKVIWKRHDRLQSYKFSSFGPKQAVHNCTLEGSTAGWRIREGMHDEPMRGRADEVKRIATDEGEFPEGARFYDPRIARLNNLRRKYEILGSSLYSRELNAFPGADTL
jgi:hypothetical protein